MLPLVPIPLREGVTRLLHKEPEQRPTAQVLTMIKFFRDPFVHALQFLDVSKMKDVHQKEHFYTTTLKELLPYMPKVRDIYIRPGGKVGKKGRASSEGSVEEET